VVFKATSSTLAGCPARRRDLRDSSRNDAGNGLPPFSRLRNGFVALLPLVKERKGTEKQGWCRAWVLRVAWCMGVEMCAWCRRRQGIRK